MFRGGRTIGLLLILGGLGIMAISAAWLASGVADKNSGLRTSGAILGGGLLFVAIILPMLAGGTYVFLKGRSEEAQLATGQRQRKLLAIVETAGQISIADLALQIGGTRDSVRDDLYDLVSKGLFSGYADWNRGILYTRAASDLRGSKTCPNCGGQLEIAGKGLIRCPYCGAEIFLP
ncbi:MAG TPA: hypothetical protein PK593_08420 [Thermomicrobiales bacterium]|nr:hypothetical protein [Thermomicrobiales bacterium]HQZ89736.1 hypothetical protein [Thermomicrobiales bacterium]HRA31864.1 hypothetical protein [Thermomicrobiales bacterium]